MNYNIVRFLFTRQNKNSALYWNQQRCDYSSMLGGYEEINLIDIEGSRVFLERNLQQLKLEHKSVLDYGGGIGRVSEQLLKDYFDYVQKLMRQIQLVDREKKYVQVAQNRLNKIGVKGLCQTVSEFERNQKYGCVWLQWVFLYMDDEEIGTLLHQLSSEIFIVKENVKYTGQEDFDESDHSVVRTRFQLLELIQKNGFKVIDEKKQEGLPIEIYNVHMFAFK